MLQVLFVYLPLWFFLRKKSVLLEQMCKNSGFLVSKLVAGSCEQDETIEIISLIFRQTNGPEKRSENVITQRFKNKIFFK